MSVTYTFEKPEPSNVGVLKNQIVVDTVIQQEPVALTLDDDQEVHITFGSELSAPEQTALATIVADHSASDTDPLWIKLARFMPSARPLRNKYDAPMDINFETGLGQRLYRDHYFVQGELRRIRYYAAATMDQYGNLTYQDLVLEENMVYTRDADGFAISRTTTITWYREDGTAHPDTKALHKFYPGRETMVEGKRRRGNIIDQLQVDIAKLLILTESTGTNQERMNLGRQLFKDFALTCDAFIEVSDRSVVEELEQASAVTYPWLENEVPNHPQEWTIRQYMVDAIDIWDIATIV